MTAPPPSRPEEPGAALFDRWQAHRDAQAAGDPLFDDDFVPADLPEVAAPTFEELGQGPEGAVVRQALAEPPAAPAPPPRRVRRPTRRRAASPPATSVAAAVVPPAPEALPAPVTASAPTGPIDVDFAPRTAARRTVGLLVLLGLAATIALAAVAWRDPTQPRIGVAAVVGLVTAVAWAVRAGWSVKTLRVRGGRLEVVRDGGRFEFDVANPRTPVEIVGQAGRRGWRVLFLRRGMAPFVVDASMVDPQAFTEALVRLRPDLIPAQN